MYSKASKIAVITGDAKHQKQYFSNFLLGLYKQGYHNVDFCKRTEFASSEDYELVCIWAHKNYPLMNFQRKRGKNYLIFERAYLGDRFSWVSVGYNGLNGNADFLNANKAFDSTRVDRYQWNSLLEPVRKQELTTRKILIVGQVPGDASIRHTNIIDWYDQQITFFYNNGFSVVFRDHPEAKTQYRHHLISEYDTNKDLKETFADVEAVVTFSSNTGVLASLAGLPVVCEDSISMCYTSEHSFKTKEELLSFFKLEPSEKNSKYVHMEQTRLQWLNKISWAQWTTEELASGECWEHLKHKGKN